MAGRVRKKRAHIRSSDFVRVAVIVVLAFAAAWLSFAVSASNVLRSVRPDLAARFAPFDARTKARKAEHAVASFREDPSAVARGAGLARQAIERDATIVSAWRTLALAAALGGNEPLSARLFEISARLSRRDLPTHLWLIERRVTQNDVTGALRHYDAALRTSASSAEILLPVLVTASADESLVGPLSRLLQTNPPWRRLYIGRLVEDAPAPANATAILESLSRLGPPPESDLMVYFVQKLIGKREFDLAWRIYRSLRRAPETSRASIRNGSFDESNPVPPFDWELEGKSDLGAEQRNIPGSGIGQSLYAYAASGNGGVVARQLMLLPPGKYIATARTDHVEGDVPARLYWSVACGDSDGTILAERDMSSIGAKSTRHDIIFVVPPTNCSGQWLYVGVRSDTNPQDVGAGIDSIGIRSAHVAKQ